MEDDPLNSLISSPLQHSPSTSEDGGITASPRATAAATTSTSLSSTSTSGNSATRARNVDVEDEDDPVCRICLDGEDDTDELGRLLVPCKCSGTARHVHQACLNSWRAADMKNGFYACLTCGTRYRLEMTTWTRIASHPHSLRYLTLLLLFVASVLAGFLADPILSGAEEPGLFALNGTLWDAYFERELHRPLPPVVRLAIDTPDRLLHHTFHFPSRNSSFSVDLTGQVLPSFDSAGAALREATSMFGYTVGDCRWFVAREAEWNGSSTSGEVLWLKKRTELTRCGRWWGYETDNEVPPVYARGAMHMIEGLLVVSLVVMMVAQLVFKWSLVAMWVPRLQRYRPITDSHTDLMTVSWAHVISILLASTLHHAKTDLRAGEPFSFLFFARFTAILLMPVVAYFSIRKAAHRLMKTMVLPAEVLDFRGQKLE